MSMKLEVPLENGLLPDRYGKYAPAVDRYAGGPVVSFPISIEGAPTATKTFALTLVDYDSIPVCGFTWIHWVVANIPADMTRLPADASRIFKDEFVQGVNSNISKFVGATDPEVTNGYTGPTPPDKTHDYTLTVYALDDKLDLKPGFYMNALRHKIEGHIIDSATIDLPSRA